ncbi:hypothetical protein Golomagni_05360 [Golovinomyces magnicellulatus]|nr:hypothetical protein Golomagni_05360 [Golovinomyces magnicellulatus]
MSLKNDAFPNSAAFDEINDYLKASDSQRQQAMKMAKSIFAFKLRNKDGDEQSWHIDLKDKGEVRKGLGQDPTGKRFSHVKVSLQKKR